VLVFGTLWLIANYIQVVPIASAVVPGQADGEPIVIHADHINMTKFNSGDDVNYIKVSEVLRIMMIGIQDQIRSRWETEARISEGRRL
jgi:hypothetical protein